MHLGVLQHSLGVLSHRGSSALLLVGLDPADILTPPKAPLLQAVPSSIQSLCTATPAQQTGVQSWVGCERKGIHRLPAEIDVSAYISSGTVAGKSGEC